MDPDIENSCHELLLRLAGRLPDRLLWRFRDWLGEGAMGTLARTLPKTLLKHRIDLDQSEYRLLVAGLIPHGADWHEVSSTLGVDASSENRYTFTTGAPDWVNTVDSVSVVVHATLRGRPDVGEVRESWRHDRGSAEEPVEGAKRVLLVTAVSGLARLTGELQRVLRVLGDESPSVEVLPAQVELPAYHEAALANSRFVCVGAVDAGHHRLVPA
ncbi:hypothetical protein SAXI111661_16345 [Saccharomonospora xinjiangensis]|uniref:Uncharacterized protein n=1 Tax=Saccharomonospora xinjiangensis XJ-54 TaxID=882086 RepID=I0V3J0_9PSEU|nr:hypothetical protein [Saccharomonospora xinjiangensis]EID54693.1 hypothetical protein SacxiDRAFT_2470 [Saccharomonospora xinjiangensis XJ-54]QBQ62347.1 hypothetical protein EYD13_20050 [Saccharomonospora xinjiangensis]